MKRTLAILVFLASPSVCPADVGTSEPPPRAFVVAEPVFFMSSLLVTVYNARFIERRSLFWSCLGMAVGMATIGLAASEDASIPVLTAVSGTASFFLSVARFPRLGDVERPPRTTALEVGSRGAQLVVRY
jgi:hypothetical protein